MTDNCKVCAFYEDHIGNSHDVENAGLCRSNPPVSQPEADQRGLWPVVSADDWCGRFEAQAA